MPFVRSKKFLGNLETILEFETVLWAFLYVDVFA